MTRSPAGWSIRLTHLDNRAVLVCISYRTPKPPWSTGRHKVSHGTKAIPRDSSFRGPRQKKSLMLRSKRLSTPTGILKMDIKYIGIAARTALRSTRRPPPAKASELASLLGATQPSRALVANPVYGGADQPMANPSSESRGYQLV